MADDEQVTVAHFKYDGKSYSIDFSDLEFDEIGMIEELTGKDLAEINWFSGRGIQGLVWVAMHRENPRVTLEHVGKLKIGKVDMSDPDGENEPEPAAKRPTKRAAGAKSGGN